MRVVWDGGAGMSGRGWRRLLGGYTWVDVWLTTIALLLVVVVGLVLLLRGGAP